ncbi:hypothetical protein RND81_10G099500 [Saponaria officinalis]|uniref:Retrovirus-related Pol polyprotein from transposon TNT 1-94-like beta-barrel domain-containing protein n=1 Tax=Saponaria officinalis TaxID=3572 RepID=A0AAW1I2V1_SAPOF
MNTQHNYGGLFGSSSADTTAEGNVNDQFAAVNFAGNMSASNAVLPDSCSTTQLVWIIDSRATDYMTSHKEQLVILRSMHKPVVVGLPDGYTKTVLYSGDVQISHCFTLKDVLYVPDFKHNLVFVSRLLLNNGFSVHFDKAKCVLQDLHSKQHVAVGLQDGGLYKFNHRGLQICQKNSGETVFLQPLISLITFLVLFRSGRPLMRFYCIKLLIMQILESLDAFVIG